MNRFARLLASAVVAVAIPTPTVHAQHHADSLHHGASDHGSQTTATPSMPMLSVLIPGYPMSRDGSGTAWQPDNAPVHGSHHKVGGWSTMLHGSLFVRYTSQDAFDSGSRGGTAFDAPHWIMGMARKPVGRRTQVAARAMLTIEPLTEGGDGYPLLFQTGETFDGKTLVDRQHPHDLFTELAVILSHAFSPNVSGFAYFGLPGEPALGPTAFMHRPSARHIPDSPLAHHWQDATHVTFGVATAGIRASIFKMDGSIFTGREPNEARYGIDKPRFDSYSVRVSANPSPEWSLQVSHGRLKSPELLEPDEDQLRTTASALFDKPLSSDTHLSLAFIWGRNEGVESDEHSAAEAGGHGGRQHSFTFEGDVEIGRTSVFGRGEWVQKPLVELVPEFGEGTVDVSAASVGVSRRLVSGGGVGAEIGGLASLFLTPSVLEPLYGATPVGLQVFLRLAPFRH